MRLLFDENLSRTLCRLLDDIFPGSEHVVAAGLEHADDAEVWAYAKSRSFTIVSKDGDFHQMSFLLGAPPKVVWLRFGNCSTLTVEGALRSHAKSIAQLIDDEEAALLVIDAP